MKNKSNRNAAPAQYFALLILTAADGLSRLEKSLVKDHYKPAILANQSSWEQKSSRPELLTSPAFDEKILITSAVSVAQGLEHRTVDPKVGGSNPLTHPI